MREVGQQEVRQRIHSLLFGVGINLKVFDLPQQSLFVKAFNFGGLHLCCTKGKKDSDLRWLGKDIREKGVDFMRFLSNAGGC